MSLVAGSRRVFWMFAFRLRACVSQLKSEAGVASFVRFVRDYFGYGLPRPNGLER
jgi:hypothetical protein